MISNDIDLAVSFLSQEDIIGMPTETVYGLAGNAYSEIAIQKIYNTKKRPNFNPLIVHIKGWEELDKIALEVPEAALTLAKKFWPGPLTLILKKQPSISESITAGKDTVAVRMPNHPVALALLSKLDFPLVAPSANPFGSISPTKAIHVDAYFEDKIPMVLEGGSCTAGVESTIVGFEAEEVVLYRYGAIPVEAIEAIVGKVRVFNKEEHQPMAPGMILKHYAPKTNFILSENIFEDIAKYKNQRIGVLLINAPLQKLEVDAQIVLTEDDDFEKAASKLYDALHELDALQLDIILAERFPDIGLGSTINDRLERASHN